ncbi:MAG: N-acetyltransferase [Treponema sp.]|nr:N-acetyltransferase [Treponema sp.]
MKIRNVTEDDANALLEIYGHYVENTAITYEYEIPTEDEFRNRIRKITEKFPYICITDGEKILGYAYASAFHERAAYQWCAELSIYIDKDAHGKGYGRILYDEIEKRLREIGIKNVYACIAYPDEDDERLTMNSVNFHSHMGFRTVGDFKKCASKFGRWYNMIWMEKIIGTHEPNPKQIFFIGI